MACDPRLTACDPQPISALYRHFAAVGSAVGASVGLMVGSLVGAVVGLMVGSLVEMLYADGANAATKMRATLTGDAVEMGMI